MSALDDLRAELASIDTKLRELARKPRLSPSDAGRYVHDTRRRQEMARQIQRLEMRRDVLGAGR